MLADWSLYASCDWSKSFKLRKSVELNPSNRIENEPITEHVSFTGSKIDQSQRGYWKAFGSTNFVEITVSEGIANPHSIVVSFF